METYLKKFDELAKEQLAVEFRRVKIKKTEQAPELRGILEKMWPEVEMMWPDKWKWSLDLKIWKSIDIRPMNGAEKKDLDELTLYLEQKLGFSGNSDNGEDYLLTNFFLKSGARVRLFFNVPEEGCVIEYKDHHWREIKKISCS